MSQLPHSCGTTLSGGQISEVLSRNGVLKQDSASPSIKGETSSLCGTQVSIPSSKHAQLVPTSSKNSPPLLPSYSTKNPPLLPTINTQQHVTAASPQANDPSLQAHTVFISCQTKLALYFHRKPSHSQFLKLHLINRIFIFILFSDQRKLNHCVFMHVLNKFYLALWKL